MIFLRNEEKRQFCPQDIGKVNLVIYEAIAEKRNCGDAQDSDDTTDNGIGATG